MAKRRASPLTRRADANPDGPGDREPTRSAHPYRSVDQSPGGAPAQRPRSRTGAVDPAHRAARLRCARSGQSARAIAFDGESCRWSDAARDRLHRLVARLLHDPRLRITCLGRRRHEAARKLCAPKPEASSPIDSTAALTILPTITGTRVARHAAAREERAQARARAGTARPSTHAPGSSAHACRKKRPIADSRRRVPAPGEGARPEPAASACHALQPERKGAHPVGKSEPS